MKTTGEVLESTPWFDDEIARLGEHASSEIHVPRTLEEITPAWLTDCLQRHHPGVTVRTLDLEVINPDLGSSSIIRLRVGYDEAGRMAGLPEHLVIKGALGKHADEFVEMDGVHLNELRFYRDILPTIRTSTIPILFAGFDPHSRQSILVMEDLTARGVRFGTALTPLTYDQAASYVDLLASLHAQTWDHPDYKPGGQFAWVSPMFDIMVEGNFMKYYFDVYMSEAYWAELDKQPRLHVLPRIFHDRERLKRAFAKMRDTAAAQPQCLVHGDSHAGNIYLLPGDEPGLFDWQVKTSSGFVDFAYNMVSSVDMGDRRLWERSLLERYLAGLRAGGVDAPDVDTAWRLYGQSLAWGLFIWITNDNDFQDPRINAACAARFCAAALDHDTYGLLGV